jgi:hypothetical protein
MGRVFGTIQVNGRKLRTLFDSGATHSYIAADAAKGLRTDRMPTPRPAGIGGKIRRVTEVCLLMGKLEGKPIEVKAFVLDDIGRDKKGHPIDILLGASEMQDWNIILVPKEERLDLSRYTKKLIEFCEIGDMARGGG